MAYFPQFSNLKPHVQAKLNARKNNSIGVSQLNAWVRLTSGVGNGLIMTSNPDYNLFRAAGNSRGIYDGAGGNATIGLNWNNVGVSAGGGNLLRPKPVVTSVEVDEGAGSISRKATISITAFTKEQMETVCEYFLEPGYTVFVEFGWNTPDSVRGLVTINTTNVAAMQDFNEVNKKRVGSNGDYENYLGYITGGSVSFDDGKWSITTNLTGYTELPFYLQTQKGVESEGKRPKTEKFNPSSIRYETDAGKRRFKSMFNDLPAERQTTDVQKLIEDANKDDFINFDERIRDKINSYVDGTAVFGISLNDEEALTEAGIIEFPAGTQIVGSERFIRMDMLMKILTAVSISGFKLGNKEVKVNFDISNTIIGAFPKMYSLDKSKLFIPNEKTPKFSFKSAIEGDQTITDATTSNAIGNIKFPINEPASGDNKKTAGNWGYLKDLYVNFDFVKSIIGTKNFAIKDVLYNILNGLSSAVNSYWQFEIQEAPDDKGVINLQIVDLNFTPQTQPTGMYEFNLSGNDSIFIESSFDMDLGGAMMNQIIGKRSSFNVKSQKDAPNVGIFSNREDKVLQAIQLTRTSNIQDGTIDSPPKPEDEKEIKKQRIDDFLGKTGMYPKSEYTEPNNINVNSDTPIESFLFIATYNDSNLFDEYKTEADVTRSTTSGEYSPILPIKFSFTIHGISGIQRGDKFKVRGIPKTFYERGFFQVTSIKHTLDGMMWKTSVEGSFRNEL